MVPKTSLPIHSQFDIADSAACARCMRDGAIAFATPVQDWRAGRVRIKKCGNAGKAIKSPTQHLHRLS
jgi:hypothetical protein